MWRTLDNLGATSADFVIVLMFALYAIGSWYMHQQAQKREERLRTEFTYKVENLQNQISRIKERYHRLDAMSYAQAKSIELMTTGEVKLVNGSANGDGDYTLNRETKN